MENEHGLKKVSIVIVDDTPENLRVLSGMLQSKGYEVRPVLSGKQALQVIKNQMPDLILLDINMPEMNGYEVCKTLKKQESTKDIPVIFISALSETLDKVTAFSVGGVDYVTKPFQMEEVNARVETHLKLRSLMLNLEDLVNQKVEEISSSQIATIKAMARLTQSRDDATGTHLERVSEYCKLIAKGLIELSADHSQLGNDYVDIIYNASSLHDIGKIGIPDAILLKTELLTSTEYDEIKTHTLIGATALEDVFKYYPNNELVKVGIEISRWHHEKWDGTGYPDGLTGTQIPLSARIMALADVYDALKSERQYKKAYSHEMCCDIILHQSEGVFDPIIIEVFKNIHEDMYKMWLKSTSETESNKKK